MFVQKVVKQAVKETMKQNTRKIVYTYSGFYFKADRDKKKDTKSIYEILSNH